MMLPTIQSMAAPAANATPPNAAVQDDSGAPAFAQCLDQARESTPSEDTAPAEDKAADASHAPAKKPARARAMPETTRVQPGTTADSKPVPRTESETAGGTTAGDASEPPEAEAPSPDIAALLPGWPPAREAAFVAAKVADTTPAIASMRSSARQPLEATPSARIEMPAATPAQPATSAAITPDTTPAARTLAPRVRDLEPTFVVAAPVTHAAAPSATAATVPTAHVNPPLDTPAFAPALAAQVRWLVQDGVQQAQLTLNPAEMGPVAVQIVIDGRDARIDFTADFAATRTAIEASLPVLAAALDDSGLKLSGGGVHDGSRSAHHGHGGSGARSSSQRNDADTTTRSERAMAESAARGLVDLVA